MDKVYCFSATGNSLYAARTIADILGAEMTLLPVALPCEAEADRVIIVTPVHAFGLPVVTAQFIRGLKTEAPVYIVFTYGGSPLGADRAAYDDAKAAGLDIRAVFALRMVNNFTVFVPFPKNLGRGALKKAPKRLENIAARIKADEAFEPKRKKGGRRFSEELVEGMAKNAERFHISEDCVGCGKCAALCPAGNITMENGRPVFGGKCVGCLGCYHRCPQKAVKYDKHNYKFRWFCPMADENELYGDR